MNESNPVTITRMALLALEALATSDASPFDKAAALKTAASAMENATIAQQSATAAASLFAKISRGGAS